jgi:hypothetical protein
MDFGQWFNSLPKFTKFYMIAVFATAFCITYVKFLPVGYYFVLLLDRVFENFEV